MRWHFASVLQTSTVAFRRSEASGPPGRLVAFYLASRWCECILRPNQCL